MHASVEYISNCQFINRGFAMQNHKVVGRVCLFMFVVGGGVSLSGMEDNNLEYLKSLANNNITGTIVRSLGNIKYTFNHVENKDMVYVSTVKKNVYIPEKSTITVEFFYDEQNIETREIIEKVTDKFGIVKYWFKQQSNFEEKAFWRSNDDGGEETCTIVTSPSKYKQSYDPNIVKPIFDKAASCLRYIIN